MNTIRTIVIDDNKEVVRSILTHFEKSESVKVVKIFNDGEAGLDFITNHKEEFDVIIMDILIPKVDGLAMLDILKERGINKSVIIMSSYKDPNIIARCMEHNIYYYILKPFSLASLESRVIESMNVKRKVLTSSKNIDNEICELLHNLGIPSHIRGYKYIRDGISMLYNTTSLSMVTKDIYPAIARKYETTASRVERAIRHAIEVSCIRGDISLMEDLFGFSVSSEKSKPTNSEFLSTIADKIKMDKRIKL